MGNDLDFVSDNLLSSNDDQVIANKRENFKKAILKAMEIRQVWSSAFEYEMAELITQETFDKGLVN